MVEIDNKLKSKIESVLKQYIVVCESSLPAIAAIKRQGVKTVIKGLKKTLLELEVSK